MKIKYVNPVDGQLVEVPLPRGTEIVRLEVPKVHLRRPLIVFVDHGGINVVHDVEEIPKAEVGRFRPTEPHVAQMAQPRLLIHSVAGSIPVVQAFLDCPAYKNCRHYLHVDYRRGFAACLASDEDCPHTCGSPEWAWWWDGWSSGIPYKRAT